MPNFQFNLLSVHKLVKDLNFKIWFSVDHCILQESLTKKLLLLGKARNGLYYTLPKDETMQSVQLDLPVQQTYPIKKNAQPAAGLGP